MKTSIDPLPKLEVVVKTKSDTFHDPLTNEMAGRTKVCTLLSGVVRESVPAHRKQVVPHSVKRLFTYPLSWPAPADHAIQANRYNTPNAIVKRKSCKEGGENQRNEEADCVHDHRYLKII